MILLAVRAALGLLAVSAVTVGFLGTHVDPAPPEVDRVGRALVAPAGERSDGKLLELSRRTTPFRADRRPPAERYGVVPVVSTPAAPPAPKPALVLTGILWGEEPTAILEGVSGVEGPVVARLGQELGPLRVVAIDSMQVVIRGMDTTWTLRVRQPW